MEPELWLLSRTLQLQQEKLLIRRFYLRKSLRRKSAPAESMPKMLVGSFWSQIPNQHPTAAARLGSWSEEFCPLPCQ